MIGVILQFANQMVEVRIVGVNCLFRTEGYGGMFVDIGGLKLDKEGAIKEYPDLKDRKDWREEAIKRFKEHIKNIDNEENRMKYIVKELMKCGYIPFLMQKEGFRPQKVKWAS